MVANAGKTIPFVLIALGLLGLLFVLAVRGGRDRPIAVITTHAVRQSLNSWNTTNGKVEPIEPRIIQAQLTTFIETVAVKEGQTVNRGQILMTLDAKDVRSELAHMRQELAAAEDERRIALGGGAPDEIAQLNSDLAKTNSEIERLRRERDSLERLYAKQAATRREFDTIARGEIEFRAGRGADQRNALLAAGPRRHVCAHGRRARRTGGSQTHPCALIC